MKFIISCTVLLLVFLFLSACVDKKQGRGARLKVACFGDSITYGFKLADPAHESYPARLRLLSHGRWHVLNFGVNGATLIQKGDIPYTSQPEFQRGRRSQPDVVVIMLGTNDTKNENWQYIDGFVSDYTALIKSVVQFSSRPRVVVCSVPPVFTRYANGINAERVEKLNILVQQAAKMTEVEFLDISAAMSGDETFFFDGVHPNARGAQKIADLIFTAITSKSSG